MRLAVLLMAAAGLAGCAHHGGYGYDRAQSPYGYRYGDYFYGGRTYDHRDRNRVRSFFTGPGARLLDPWLARTEEGREIVSLGFSDARDGRISEQTAHRANIWFRRYADTDWDMALTDEEIRIALVQAAGSRAWERGRY